MQLVQEICSGRWSYPKQFPFVSEQNSAFFAKRILMSRDQWIMRQIEFGFYTLGTPSYLDAAISYSIYLSRCTGSNITLKAIVSPIINAIPIVFSRLLGIPQSNIRHLQNTCLPGVHIFTFTANSNGHRLTDFHRDRQHTLIQPLIQPVLQNASFFEPISFTLPLQLPTTGGGLLMLQQSSKDNQNSLHLERRILYSCGQIVVHDGQNLHRIDDSYKVCETDCRLTLQGHGLIVDDDSFYYYW